MLVSIDTSPLQTGHEHRGIGLYTKLLVQELNALTDLTLLSETNQTKTPDVIHYPFFDLFFATLPIYKKAPTVVTIHDVIPLQFPNQYRPGIRGNLKFLWQRLALTSVAAVITDSQASKKAIKDYLGLADQKIHVVYLAGNPAIVPASPKILKEVQHRYSLPDEYLLYVGDINYNKNIPELIKTLSLLPENYSLVLAGKHFTYQAIPEWLTIEATVKKYGLSNRVRYLPNLGSKPDQTLSALYQQATVYVQPSLAEGFGLPVLEALQVGTPVLSSNTTSLPEIGGEVVVYAQPQAKAMATAFMETIATWKTADHRQFQDKASRWLKQFSWQKTAQATKEVYQSLL